MKRRIPAGAPGRERKKGRKAGLARSSGEAAAPAHERGRSRSHGRSATQSHTAATSGNQTDQRRDETPRARSQARTTPDTASEPLSLFAISTPGLEDITAAELRALKIESPVVEPGGVAFTGTLDDLYRVNLWLRTASRVVVRVARFHASEFHELERRAKRVGWERYLGAPGRVRFRVTCRKSRLYHSDAVAERLARSIEQSHGLAGGFAIASADDPAGDERAANDEVQGQLFIVRLVHDEVTISADASGELLHRRGYRQAVAKAPLRETIAAAMLAGSGWVPEMPLADPMCGSGTIAIEAAMTARNMAPGVDHAQRRSRAFAFMNWVGFDDRAWEDRVERTLKDALPSVPAPILASDRDAGAIAAARANAERAGVAGDIELREAAVSSLALPDARGAIVSNPPYGVRVGESAPLRNLYAQLGRVLRDRAHGWTLALLTADRALERQVGVRFDEVFRVSNGGIPVRLVRAVVD